MHGDEGGDQRVGVEEDVQVKIVVQLCGYAVVQLSITQCNA
jgi:hypothetical protein